ncbi:MAG: TetR/AcrR family transcriptional regulator, partial [Thermoleophilaceae bacterium]
EAMLNHGPGRERVARARETIEPLATEVIRRAQDSGQLRRDLDPLDVPLMNMMLGGLADTTRAVAPDYWRRALQILLDGLAVRRDEPTPLPAAPLDRGGFETAMTRRGR